MTLSALKLVVVALWPLLFANIVLWYAVAHSPLIASFWCAALIGSAYLLPDR